ncbi:MAG: lysophospholipase [Bacteroidales bacterium]|nr:lysophospholipase [Bacteroidales bacterium]
MDYKSKVYTSIDGIKLSGYLWQSSENPKAVINLVHGFGEYGERYNQWALQFAEKSYAVHAIDYRGHGKSDGRRGYVDEYNDFLNDIDTLIQESRKLFPNAKQLIYGHSLGGNIVANYILKRQSNLDAAIISSPWYKLAFKLSPVKMFLLGVMNRLYPKFTQKSNLELESLSSDEKIVDTYINDPLVHGKISARMFSEVYKAGLWVLENTDKISIPILIQHGDSDRITSIQASNEFFNKAIEKDKNIEYKVWKGMYHELHNEINKDQVFEFITHWIAKTIK